MGFWMFFQLLQLLLQFNNRLFKVELMFHRLEASVSTEARQRGRIPFGTDKEPDLHPALSGDEVYTPSPRRSEGWRGQLSGRCSNRTTSKTSTLTLNEQRNLLFTLYNRYTRTAICSKRFCVRRR